MSDNILFSMEKITKLFPGMKALDEVNFSLKTGEVHSLVGENGAGKSTLIKVMTGVYQNEGGSMLLSGKAYKPVSPVDAQRHGISTVYQEVNLIPELSVEENIFIGRQPKKMGMIRWKEIRRRSKEALARLDLNIDTSQPLNSFSIAIQQMIAIARALDINAKALILDEPTSSLDKHEVKQLFTIIKKLKEQGMGVIFISHFLDQIFEISDRITILRNGRLISTHDIKEISQLEMVSKMTGKSVEYFEDRKQRAKSAEAKNTEPVLKANGITKKNVIAPFDLEVRKGEIIGLAGLLGSGRTEMVEFFFGIKHPDKGIIEFKGKKIKIKSPRMAIRNGIGFLPEDRKTQSIIPDLSIRENMILTLQSQRGWLRPISRKKQDNICDEYIKLLNIATTDASKPICQLSGGNQQKVILARWLLSNPDILILDEPTRGIDVGAKAEIEDIINSLCDRGVAVIFISGELEEVERNCGRVIILRDRQKIAELQGGEISLKNMMNTIAEGAKTNEEK